MANDNRAELRQVIAQISAIDPVVALDLSAMLGGLVSIEGRVAALVARETALSAAVVNAAQPSKVALIGVSAP